MSILLFYRQYKFYSKKHVSKREYHYFTVIFHDFYKKDKFFIVHSHLRVYVFDSHISKRKETKEKKLIINHA